MFDAALVRLIRLLVLYRDWVVDFRWWLVEALFGHVYDEDSDPIPTARAGLGRVFASFLFHLLLAGVCEWINQSICDYWWVRRTPDQMRYLLEASFVPSCRRHGLGR